MKYPHPIRLRGPWEYRVLDSHPASSESASRAESRTAHVHFPSSWPVELGGHFRGTVRFSRRFNRPARLDPHERLWLVLDGVLSAGNASLNGEALVADYRHAALAEFEITDQTQTTNQLELDVRRDLEHDERLGEARLEVRSTHFLRATRATLETSGDMARLAIHGQVVGPDVSDLAIVANAAGRELAYCPVSSGQSFEIVRDAQAGVEKLEIELIAGGAVHWTEELIVAGRSYF